MKKKKTKKNFKAIMVRVTLEDYAKLEKIAKKDRRTVTGWVRAVALDVAEGVKRD